MKKEKSDSVLKKHIMEVVGTIPLGKVMYFGQISTIVGGNARVVGFILTGLSQEECDLIPWYRVVAKDGYISSLKLGMKGVVQKQRLEAEKYTLYGDYVDMEKHLWQ